MKKIVYLALILTILLCCAHKQEKVERIIEDGVEVVINHLESYKIKGESSTLILEEELIIDFEREDLAEIGIGEFAMFDVDSEGYIYFWTQGSSEDFIFKFDKNGNFVTSFGRKGQGPGELQFPTYLKINSHDEIIITDQHRRKLMIFTLDGRLIEEKPVDFSTPVIIPLYNGKYLVYFFQHIPEVKSNYQLILLYSSNFNKIKELDRMKPINTRTATSIKGINHWLMASVTKKNIYLGSSERGYDIWVYDLEGNLERKIRKEYKPVPITEEFKLKYMKRFERAREELRKKIYFPESQPPFQYCFTDEGGRLFVMTYEKGESPREYKYDIFNPNGAFIGRLSLENYGQYGMSETPLFAMVKRNHLYCIREKESGFKELVVYKMRWE